MRVEDPADLSSALKKCIDSEGAFLLDVAVEAQANCFPMVPAGRGQHEVMLSEDVWYSDVATQ